MQVVLIIATILGGMAAIWFFWDKYKAKDTWTEKEKVVNSGWWEKSDLKREKQAQGYSTFFWSNQDRIQERIGNGYEIIFEIDRPNRIKYRLGLKNGQVLMGKLVQN